MAWRSPGSGPLESSSASGSAREGTQGGGDTGHLHGASGRLSGANVLACLEAGAALFCAEAETTRGKAERFPLPAPIPSPKSKALSPWKPGQLFLLAEGLSPDWNDSFELEDIISLAC